MVVGPQLPVCCGGSPVGPAAETGSWPTDGSGSVGEEQAAIPRIAVTASMSVRDIVASVGCPLDAGWCGVAGRDVSQLAHRV